MTKTVKSFFPANPQVASVAKTTKALGYAHAKGARAAARKAMGANAVEGTEFVVVDTEGGRFDWHVAEAPPPAPPVQEVPPVANAAVSRAADAFGTAALATLSVDAQQRSARANDAVGGRRETDITATPKKDKVANEIQNGVRKPSEGTVCRAVWDELDKLNEATGNPDSKAVKKLAEDKKWNANNASIEFYQWRKFHGIRGRVKAAPAIAQQSDKKPSAKPAA